MANTYALPLLKRELAARQTFAFSFEKPQAFSFTAGQFLRLKLSQLAETESRDNVRSLSIASAPFEDNLLVAMRHGESLFKKTLGALAMGSKVEISGPYGRFTLHEEPGTPAVFLAGGIGITPMRSMILQALHEGRRQQLFLFYANRTMEDAAFFKEFALQAKRHPTFHFVPMITVEKQRIDREALGQHLADLQTPIYYIAGPPGMVTAMRSMLADARVLPERIRFEQFSGYE